MIKSAQVEAAALAERRLDDPVTAATLVETAETESTLVERAAALAWRVSALTTHAPMAVTASSSYFLQVEKASLQAFRPLATSDVSEILQPLILFPSSVYTASVQQAQASSAVSASVRS